MLQAVAHDLRSPLAVASGYVRMLRDGSIDPTSSGVMTHPLDVVEEKLAECRRLVNELLVAARRETSPVPEKVMLNLAEIAERAVDRAWPRALLIGAHLAVETPHGLVTARGDAADVDRILNNLLGNALEHVGARPQVTVIVGRDSSPFISVGDDGPGIPVEDRDRIFERFVRGAGSNGAGLGLHLSRVDRLYVLDPDRLSRKYAYQVLILEELARCGVDVVFLKNPIGRGPEQDLLLQVQGMIAEYERAKIMERCRRGKQHAARRGSVNVLSGAPYGYRYVGKHDGGGEARYQVLAEEARVVRRIFDWVGQERCSIGEVCRRLRRDGIPTRTGKPAWDRATVWLILKNPAYSGKAAFGKTRAGEYKPRRLRPQRGRPGPPRRPFTTVETSQEEQIFIDVPALVSEELFEAVQAQLEENRRRRRDRPGGGRYLLQGLVVCQRCGYGCYGKPTSRASAKGKVPYAYYRCTGSDAHRFGGQRLCWNKQIRTDMLDAAVWEDVRRLLSEPERVRKEYERRLQGSETGPDVEVQHLSKMVSNVKKMISRLIDAYGDGLLDKSEFEPRISAARERLAKLEADYRQRISEASQEAELRLVIGQLEEFARRVSQGLQEPDWETRREIVRAWSSRSRSTSRRFGSCIESVRPLLKGAPNEVLRNIVGGVCSPALANWTLDGLQRLLAERFPDTPGGLGKPKVHLVRYADDFLITGNSKGLLRDQVRPLVAHFLKGRGLEVSHEKTQITHIGDGFDFLGQNVRRYRWGKVLTKPSRRSVKTFLARIRETIDGSGSQTAGEMIRRLN